MKPNLNTVERAFELARSGKCVTLKEVRSCLHAEGYSQSLIVGRYLSAQLRQLMREANPRCRGLEASAMQGLARSRYSLD
jgi:hypothetical protein